jgi:hypothetical protein
MVKHDDTTLNTLLRYLSDLESDLQRALYNSHKTTKQFGIEISTLKSKVATFKEQVPIGNTIVMGELLVHWSK